MVFLNGIQVASILALYLYLLELVESNIAEKKNIDFKELFKQKINIIPKDEKIDNKEIVGDESLIKTNAQIKDIFKNTKIIPKNTFYIDVVNSSKEEINFKSGKKLVKTEVVSSSEHDSSSSVESSSDKNSSESEDTSSLSSSEEIHNNHELYPTKMPYKPNKHSEEPVLRNRESSSKTSVSNTSHPVLKNYLISSVKTLMKRKKNEDKLQLRNIPASDSYPFGPSKSSMEGDKVNMLEPQATLMNFIQSIHRTLNETSKKYVNRNKNATVDALRSSRKDSDETKQESGSGFGSSCNKGASKACINACKGVLKSVCYEYKCSSGMKSKFKAECTKNCKVKFSVKNSRRKNLCNFYHFADEVN